MTLSALITDFLEYLKLCNASCLTIRNYNHYLKRFLEFSTDIDPREIDLSLVGKYKLHLSRWRDPNKQKPLKRITQNYFLIALRAFLRYLAGRDIQTLPAEKVGLGKSEPRPLKVLDGTQLKSLLEAPDPAKKDGLRDRAILQTLFSTGLRVSELVKLNRDMINTLLRDRHAPLSGARDDVLKWALERYLGARKDTFRPLFIRFQGHVDPTNGGEAMRLTPRSIQRIVEKFVTRLRLPIKATPQTLRHSFSQFT